MLLDFEEGRLITSISVAAERSRNGSTNKSFKKRQAVTLRKQGPSVRANIIVTPAILIKFRRVRLPQSLFIVAYSISVSVHAIYEVTVSHVHISKPKRDAPWARPSNWLQTFGRKRTRTAIRPCSAITVKRPTHGTFETDKNLLPAVLVINDNVIIDLDLIQRGQRSHVWTVIDTRVNEPQKPIRVVFLAIIFVDRCSFEVGIYA